MALTLSLLVSSADHLCKQFGIKSGPTRCRDGPDLDPNCLTLDVISELKMFLKKLILMSKSRQTYIQHAKS